MPTDLRKVIVVIPDGRVNRSVERTCQIDAIISTIQCVQGVCFLYFDEPRSAFDEPNLNTRHLIMIDHCTSIWRDPQELPIVCRFDEEAHEKRRFDELLEESATMLTSFFVSDFFPYLAWIDKLTGLTDRLEKNFKNLDEFYEELIEQHLDPNKPKSIEGDLLDILLQLKKEKSTSIDLTLEDIKAILMNVLLAGSDTSAAAIIWAMTTLIKNPKVMKKVQEEIRRSVGKKDGILNEDDIQNLPYFKAVIKESFRLYPSVPLLIPRESMEKSTLEGYEIQTGTIIHVNAWAIARDPEIWENPEKFIPERFLNNNIDFKGQDFEFIPFGAGRRGCPGIALGVASMELASSNLLYAFDWELPRGMKKEDINTDAKRGLTTHKKNDLCLRIIYRFMQTILLCGSRTSIVSQLNSLLSARTMFSCLMSFVF
ncbi:Cytochrome [Capsicum annuum]|nr:Cytochrome [Capsicum annuum]KAF3638178.1 Cytochrome [Capsicum annuum]